MHTQKESVFHLKLRVRLNLNENIKTNLISRSRVAVCFPTPTFADDFFLFFHVIPIENDKIERGEKMSFWGGMRLAASPSAYQVEVGVAVWQFECRRRWRAIDRVNKSMNESGILKISQLQDVLGILKQCLLHGREFAGTSSAPLQHTLTLYRIQLSAPEKSSSSTVVCERN